MMLMNRTMVSAKRAAPRAKLLDGSLKDGKKNPKTVGVSRKLWARSDNTPVAIRMIC